MQREKRFANLYNLNFYKYKNRWILQKPELESETEKPGVSELGHEIDEHLNDKNIQNILKGTTKRKEEYLKNTDFPLDSINEIPNPESLCSDGEDIWCNNKSICPDNKDICIYNKDTCSNNKDVWSDEEGNNLKILEISANNENGSNTKKVFVHKGENNQYGVRAQHSSVHKKETHGILCEQVECDTRVYQVNPYGSQYDSVSHQNNSRIFPGGAQYDTIHLQHSTQVFPEGTQHNTAYQQYNSQVSPGEFQYGTVYQQDNRQTFPGGFQYNTVYKQHNSQLVAGGLQYDTLYEENTSFTSFGEPQNSSMCQVSQWNTMEWYSNPSENNITCITYQVQSVQMPTASRAGPSTRYILI